MTSTQGWQGDSANGTADKARQEGRAVAQTTAEEGKGVAREARAQGQAVVDQAKDEANRVMQDAKSQLRGQADEQTKKVTESLRRLGEHVDALAQGRPEEAGPLTDYVKQAADKLHEVVNRVESRGFDGIVQDTERFARRRPGAFLLAAAVAGFSASRLLRAGSDAKKADEGSTQGSAEMTTPYPRQPVAPTMPQAMPPTGPPPAGYAGPPPAGYAGAPPAGYTGAPPAGYTGPAMPEAGAPVYQEGTRR